MAVSARVRKDGAHKFLDTELYDRCDDVRDVHWQLTVFVDVLYVRRDAKACPER